MVTLTICTSCRPGPVADADAAAPASGARLAAMVEQAAGNRTDPPGIIRHECLWACRSACVVLIQSPGKTGYLAGRFVPEAAAAEALLDWSDAYLQSPAGDVPYTAWPEGMKGHFIARIPLSRRTTDEQ